jgi:hypothetical protein
MKLTEAGPSLMPAFFIGGAILTSHQKTAKIGIAYTL